MDAQKKTLAEITEQITALAVRLQHSSDFPTAVAEAKMLIGEHLLSFDFLSYYLLEEYPASITHYFLFPAPVGKEQVELAAEGAEVRAWQKRQPQIWHDEQAIPPRSGVSIPIAKGTITFAAHGDDSPSEDKLRALETAARAMEMLILRHDDLHELEMLRAQTASIDQDLLALYDGSYDLSADEPQDVLYRIVQMITDKLDFDRAGIFLLDEQEQVLRGALGMDDDGAIVPISTTIFQLYPEDDCSLTETALIARGELSYFFSRDLDGEGHRSIEGNIQANVAVPMRVGKRIIGVIAADNYYSGAPIHEHQIRPFMIIANQGAVAYERARLFSSLRDAHGSLEQQVKERTAELLSTNAELSNALQEREILLKEIHHRVKNNLQVISSLLSLQESHIEDEKISQLLRESGNRLHAMALIHETLYQSVDLKNIDLADFLPQLIRHVFESYEVVPAKIALRIEVEPLVFEADAVVNFGLIINELVSNAFKYAFPGERRGHLQVIAQREEQELVLTVSDDGVGIAAHVDIGTSPSMGMQVVHALVRQQRGSLILRRDGGTTIEMRFPLLKLAP